MGSSAERSYPARALPRRRGPKPSTRRARPPRTATFSTELHRLRLELFAANQARIGEAIEGYSDAFRRYEARYQATVQKARGPSSYGALIDATRAARVVLAGDYHTFAAAQRAFLQLLEAQPAGDRIAVALEMLLGKHQPTIDRYLAGRITEATFLRRIELARHWPFGASDGLRAIFALARARGWPVVAIDLEASGPTALAERDQYAAARIAEALAASPELRAFALIGECHLAPDHLPRAMKRQLASHGLDGEVLRVHQNPDAVWFDLDARGLAEEHDVLDLGDSAFALLTASPLVCQQSFLTWLEQADEGSPLAPIEDPESGERLVQQAQEVICRALELPLPGPGLLEVVGPHDLSFFERLEGSGGFSRRELRELRAQILASESYYLPRARMIYLATLSLSHAAEEAAHALRHSLSGEGLDEPQLLRDAFYCRVMNEAIGFLGSKLVNPKRRCPHPEELAGLARDTTPSLDREAAQLVLAHKELERGRAAREVVRAFQSSAEVFNAVTHLLGYILGDQLYYALMRGKIPARDVRRLFHEPLEEEGAAVLAYFELIGRVGRVRVPRSRAPAI